MSSKIVIVEAGIEHLSQAAQLFDGYRQFYKQEPNLTGAEQFLRSHIQNGTSVIFLAFDGTEAVGFAQLYPSFSSVSMKKLWIVNDLYVAPNARRHKLGTLLLDKCRQLAVDTQAKGLQLSTALTNTGAQALYESVGYQRDNEYYTYELML
eukprot:TRINITY_DN7648_c0_g1_i1.p1 TRINITY_DN7648_c0_g1~~TRINITY_DN7648_c0_g1_i1.p1  ORF type:complete len:158 (-),score=9.64 TRINITY_DN7648_c0_g1_i1:94-546(-)